MLMLALVFFLYLVTAPALFLAAFTGSGTLFWGTMAVTFVVTMAVAEQISKAQYQRAGR